MKRTITILLIIILASCNNNTDNGKKVAKPVADTITVKDSLK